MPTLNEVYSELMVLSEASIDKDVVRWLRARLGVKSVRSGSGTTKDYVVVGGQFDGKTQEALRLLGFQVSGTSMAMIKRAGPGGGKWDELVAWAKREVRRGLVGEGDEVTKNAWRDATNETTTRAGLRS